MQSARFHCVHLRGAERTVRDSRPCGSWKFGGFHVMLLILWGGLLVLLGEAHAKKHEHDDAYCGDDE